MLTKTSRYVFALFLVMSAMTASISAVPVTTTSKPLSHSKDAETSTSSSGTASNTISQPLSSGSSNSPEPTPVFDPPKGYKGGKIPEKTEEVSAACNRSKNKRSNTDDEDDGDDEIPCELNPPENRMLNLKQPTSGAEAFGKIGKLKEYSTYSEVYYMDGWSTLSRSKEKLIAKGFKYWSYGIDELRNLLAIGELVDWGFTVEEPRSLWGILKWQRGDRIVHLKSYKTAVRGKDKAACEAYMDMARKAIVEASEPYMQMPGCPIHGSLIVDNVLFWEEKDTISEKIKLHANLENWVRIIWKLEAGKELDVKKLPALEKKLLESLERGYAPALTTDKNDPTAHIKPHFYDFSNFNQCLQDKFTID